MWFRMLQRSRLSELCCRAMQQGTMWVTGECWACGKLELLLSATAPLLALPQLARTQSVSQIFVFRSFLYHSQCTCLRSLEFITGRSLELLQELVAFERAAGSGIRLADA
jgi:hypothetical protein